MRFSSIPFLAASLSLLVACGDDDAPTSCTWKGVTHPIGARFADDCNTCECEADGSVQCTLIECADGSVSDAGRDAGDPGFDGGDGDGGADAGGDDGGSDAGEAFDCRAESSSSLPGVTLTITSTDCEFTLAEAAAGIDFDYVLEVTDAAPEVVLSSSPPGVTCARADAETGFYVYEEVAGRGARYCECDNGLCPPISVPAMPVTGDHAFTLSWTGRNWNGPSDTGMPLGAPFPAGVYAFAVRAQGTAGGVAYVVESTLPIRLVP